MVRNPRFREWSAAAQPDGNPDRILIRLDLSGARGAAAVADGTSDFLLSIGQISVRRLLLPAPPGPAPDQPAADHQLSCPSTSTPRRSTTCACARPSTWPWTAGAPSSATAARSRPGRPARSCLRAWPATSATAPTPGTPAPTAAGTHQTWRAPAGSSPPPARPGCRSPSGMSCRRPRAPSTKPTTWSRRSASSATGPRCACSRTAPTSPTPTTPATTPRSSTAAGAPTTLPPTISSASWPAPTSSPATHSPPPTPANSAIPAVDRQIARAAAQQATNPAAAASLWAQLDRKLTDLAILVPTVTPNEIDFLSSRVRNYQYNPVWGALVDQFWIR